MTTAMRDVFIVGEDPVTRAIIHRLVKEYAPEIHIKQSLPARGGEIKSKIAAFNQLALSYPVILLVDMDNDPCPPIAKSNLLKDVLSVSPEFVVNIAVDEGETWLFADREGFAHYFDLPLELVPESRLQKFQGMKARVEVDIPMKSSYFLTHFLISTSRNQVLREQIRSTSSCKGKEYNSAILPFVSDSWNPEAARVNSYSLDKMIQRLQRL